MKQLVNVSIILLLTLSLCWAEEEPVEEKVIIYNTSEGMPDLNKINLKTTPSGLQYTDLVKGEDFLNPGLGQIAVVHYTGWLLDGRKFDSSENLGRPFEFRIGSNRVIKGWDEGVSLMEKGATRLLVIPAHLAYGKQGSVNSSPRIPPKATLVFQIELIDIK